MTPHRHAGWIKPLLLFAIALGIGLVGGALWVWRHPPHVGGSLASDETASLGNDRRSLPAPVTGGKFDLPTPTVAGPDAPHVVANTPPPAPPLPAADTGSMDGAETAQGALPSTNAHLPTDDDHQINANDHGPRLSQRVQPQYPRQALRDGVEGSVRVRVMIDEQGNVSDVQVVYGSGSNLLDRAALDAVREWHYQPAIHHGQPVASTVDVPIDFKLGAQ
ncbi:MAG: energy transducer TonB [Proteobacteria bacterium]|nr:energy transducer TonB [Pseudomonadota bacterium]